MTWKCDTAALPLLFTSWVLVFTTIPSIRANPINNTIIRNNDTATTTFVSELDRSLNFGILPVLSGMPCFTAYKIAEFHSSTGENVRCKCDRSPLHEIPILTALLQWDCDNLNLIMTHTLAPLGHPTKAWASFDTTTIVPQNKPTRKPIHVAEPGAGLEFGQFAFSYPPIPVTTTKPAPSLSKFPISDFDYDIFELKPKETATNSIPTNFESPAIIIDSEVTTQNVGGAVNHSGSTRMECNYCVQQRGFNMYNCIPAFNYECVTELKKLEEQNIPANCMTDTWTHALPTKVCYVEMLHQRIYMILSN